MRLVFINGKSIRVIDGRKMIAEFEAARPPSAQDIEDVRVADYSLPPSVVYPRYGMAGTAPAYQGQ